MGEQLSGAGYAKHPGQLKLTGVATTSKRGKPQQRDHMDEAWSERLDLRLFPSIRGPVVTRECFTEDVFESLV